MRNHLLWLCRRQPSSADSVTLHCPTVGNSSATAALAQLACRVHIKEVKPRALHTTAPVRDERTELLSLPVSKQALTRNPMMSKAWEKQQIWSRTRTTPIVLVPNQTTKKATNA